MKQNLWNFLYQLNWIHVLNIFMTCGLVLSMEFLLESCTIYDRIYLYHHLSMLIRRNLINGNFYINIWHCPPIFFESMHDYWQNLCITAISLWSRQIFFISPEFLSKWGTVNFLNRFTFSMNWTHFPGIEGFNLLQYFKIWW